MAGGIPFILCESLLFLKSITSSKLLHKIFTILIYNVTIASKDEIEVKDHVGITYYSISGDRILMVLSC